MLIVGGNPSWPLKVHDHYHSGANSQSHVTVTKWVSRLIFFSRIFE